MKMKKKTRKTKKKIPYPEMMSISSAIDSGGAWDARAPPKVGGSEKRTKPTMLPISSFNNYLALPGLRTHLKEICGKSPQGLFLYEKEINISIYIFFE